MHDFVALKVSDIPDSTKANITTFGNLPFSNDFSRVLLDGYNEQNELVHPDWVLNAWLKWEPEETRQAIIDNLISGAIRLTKAQLEAERRNENSIWYAGPVEVTHG